MSRKNQSGQATIEAVLIATLLIGLSSFTMRQLRSRDILSRLVERPWTYVSGMIENGIWAPPQIGQINHPNHLDRHASPQGDPQ